MSRTPWTPNSYPHTRRCDHVDVYKSKSKGDVRVEDPYRWLETQSEETGCWINAQDTFTRDYLNQNPHRDDLEKEITANVNYAEISPPSYINDGRWYWFYNSGLQDQFVLYRSKDSTLPDFSDGAIPEGEVFFDANLLSDDGSSSLAEMEFSKSGEYFAYGVSRSGTDVFTVYVRSTNRPFDHLVGDPVEGGSGRLEDEVRFVKFSKITWTPDSKGFLYQRYPESSSSDLEDDLSDTELDQHARLYYHRIGTPQSEDVLIVEDPVNPDWSWEPRISADDKYITMNVARDTSESRLLWIAELENGTVKRRMKWRKIFNDFDAAYIVVGNIGSRFFVRTDKDAPQYNLAEFDFNDKVPSLRDVIPEGRNAYMSSADMVNNDVFVVVYKRNVNDEIYLYSTEGKRLRRLAYDFVGTASITANQAESWFFVNLVGFTTPGIVARYDFMEQDDNKRWSIYRSCELTGMNVEDFKVEQVWYKSSDGTDIPMFIVRHKSTPRDGTAPAIQYGYGGFMVSTDPFFSIAILTFLQRYRAVLAVPSIRGGGEFGEEWHLAGTRERKVNVYDDFLAASRYLVNKRYAAQGKIIVTGGSNGGLLVAACINRDHEGLIGAGVAEVGVFDMLRFSEFTIGRSWTAEYGDPRNPNDFDFIYPLSPLHNIPKSRTLPPMLLLTGDHDDRVVPSHSYKFAATLQHLHSHNKNPLLIRIDRKSGHGDGKTTAQNIRESSDKWGFAAQSLGLTWHELES